MASKKGEQVAIRGRIRPGEGSELQTKVHRSATVDGGTSVTVSFDLSDAPVPDRRYVAEAIKLLASEEEFRICFAQRKLGTDTALRSLLVVHVSFEGMARYLNTLSNEFGKTLSDYASRARLPEAQVLDIKDEPAQTVALTANIIGSSFSGRDACLDFYHTSAFAISALKHGAPFVVDPVVRVTLNTAQLLSLVNQLHSLRHLLPQDEEES